MGKYRKALQVKETKNGLSFCKLSKVMFRLGKPKRYWVDLSTFFSLVTKSQFGNF